MAQEFVSGFATAIKYDYETSFGSGGTPTYPFGHGTKITVNKNNNLERLYGVGSRNAQKTIAKKFEGSLTIEFVLGNAYWLRGVIGAQGAAGGAGPYTHAFTEANAPPSMYIIVSTELGTNDMVTAFTGVVVNSARMVMAENEAVKVTLECFYKTESTAASGGFSWVEDTYSEPLTFAHGSITYAGQSMGTTYSGIVKNVELSIVNNVEMLFGIGSRTAQSRVFKNREYNWKINYALTSVSNSADVFENVLGDTSTPWTPASGNITGVNMVWTISNGGASTALRSLVFTMTNALTFMNTSSMLFDVNEVLKDDVDGWSGSISTLVWTDNNNSGIGA